MHDYYELTKPRMVMANVLVAVAVYLFGAGGHIAWGSLALLVIGLSLTIGGACALNNTYDRALDAKMSRTKSRVMVTGRITPNSAIVFGSALGAIGLVLLSNINPLALLAGFIGFATYVFIYTPLKHTNPLALYVGAVAGATPPLTGYAAATGMYDWYALLFFACMFLWQIPHFLAIARYRYKEYTAAGVPLLVDKPNERTRRQARAIFFGSLVLLLLACVMVATMGFLA